MLRSIIILLTKEMQAMMEESCSNYSECLQNVRTNRKQPKRAFPRYYTQSKFQDRQNHIKHNQEMSSLPRGTGKWTIEEQRVYIEFLKKNIEEMRGKVSRKSQKVFLKMSRLIKTRTPDQCRSHHQKILMYHSNLEEAIRFFDEDVFCKSERMEDGKASNESFSKQNFYHMEILPGNIIRIIINEKAICVY